LDRFNDALLSISPDGSTIDKRKNYIDAGARQFKLLPGMTESQFRKELLNRYEHELRYLTQYQVVEWTTYSIDQGCILVYMAAKDVTERRNLLNELFMRAHYSAVDEKAKKRARQ
jgi:nitrogen-specific signal transduction histidine kinase